MQQIPEAAKNPDGSVKCSKVIRKCKYNGKLGSHFYCDYLCQAGHSRGGDPERCRVFVAKSR